MAHEPRSHIKISSHSQATLSTCNKTSNQLQQNMRPAAASLASFTCALIVAHHNLQLQWLDSTPTSHNIHNGQLPKAHNHHLDPARLPPNTSTAPQSAAGATSISSWHNRHGELAAESRPRQRPRPAASRPVPAAAAQRHGCGHGSLATADCHARARACGTHGL